VLDSGSAHPSPPQMAGQHGFRQGEKARLELCGQGKDPLSKARCSAPVRWSDRGDKGTAPNGIGPGRRSASMGWSWPTSRKEARLLLDRGRLLRAGRCHKPSNNQKKKRKRILAAGECKGLVGKGARGRFFCFQVACGKLRFCSAGGHTNLCH